MQSCNVNKIEDRTNPLWGAAFLADGLVKTPALTRDREPGSNTNLPNKPKEFLDTAICCDLYHKTTGYTPRIDLHREGLFLFF